MIKGFSEPKRIPRVGKIYLGDKKEGSNGKEYPSATDYFVVRADGTNTWQTAADAFHAVYGDTPREITVAFPSDDPENFMPQYLYSYHGGGGKHELWCKGNGETAGRADGAGGYTQIPCLYKDCPIYQARKCKEVTRILFLLPEVEGIGVWELDTTSYYGSQNLLGSINLIRHVTRGKIAMIPLTLRIIPQVVNPDGKTKTVYVLDLKLENIKLMDLLVRIPQLGSEEPMKLVEPIRDDIPDDLFIESSLVSEEDISPSPSPAPPTPAPQEHTVELKRMGKKLRALKDALGLSASELSKTGRKVVGKADPKLWSVEDMEEVYAALQQPSEASTPVREYEDVPF